MLYHHKGGPDTAGMDMTTNTYAVPRRAYLIFPLLIVLAALAFQGYKYLGIWETGLIAAVLHTAYMAWLPPKKEAHRVARLAAIFVGVGAAFTVISYINVIDGRNTATRNAKWAEVGLLPPKACNGVSNRDVLLAAYKAGKPIAGWCDYQALPGKELPAALVMRPRVKYDCGQFANTVGKDLAAQGYDVSAFCTVTTTP